MWIPQSSRTTRRPAAARRSPAAWRAALAAAAALLVITAVAACDPGERDRGLAGTDTARGDVDTARADSGARRAGAERTAALDYIITEERYQRWVAAQRVLDTLPNLPPPPGLDPDRVTEADIARAVAYLERDPRVRAAFRQAGLDAREYVMTAVALDQALVMTTRPTSARYRGVPRRTLDLVAGRREDLEALRSAARYRITERAAEQAADTPRAADTAGADTAATVGDTSAAAPAGAARVIAAGTAISLRTDARVCTNTHKAGDRITAKVTTSVAGTNGAAIPAGATATLTVTGFKRGEGASGPTAIDFRMSSIAFGGHVYAVEGAVTSAQAVRIPGRPGGGDSQKVTGVTAGTAAESVTAGQQGCVPNGATLQVTLRNPLHVRA